MDQASSFTGLAPSTIPQSQLELDEMDGRKLTDALPSLHILSTTLLDFFKVTSEEEMIELHDELRNEKTWTAKTFKGQRDRFLQELEHFRPSGLFIDLSVAIRAMLGVTQWAEVGDGGWRADDVLHLANVTELLCGLVPLSRQHQDARTYLGALLSDFPTPFLSDLVESTSQPGDSAQIEETLLLALELRAQCLILWLMKQEGDSATAEDANSALNDIFHIPGTDDVLRGFPPDVKDGYASWTLRDADGALPIQYYPAGADIKDRIMQYWSPSAIDVTGLDSEFPWTEFLFNLCSWAQRRTAELNDRISDHSPNVVRQNIRERLQSTDSWATEPHFSAVDVQHFVKRKRRESGISNPAKSLATRAPAQGGVQEIDDPPQQVTRSSGNPFQAPPSAQAQQSPRNKKPEPSQEERRVTQEFMARYDADKRQGNKENIPNSTVVQPKKRFIDAQPGARRVSSSDSEEVTSPPKPANKRQRVQDDESGEDGFEEDRRNVGKDGKGRAMGHETRKKTSKAPSAAQKPTGRKENSAQKHTRNQIPESAVSEDALFVASPTGDDDDHSASQDSVTHQLQAALSAVQAADRRSSHLRDPSQVSNRSQSITVTQASQPTSTARSGAEVYAVANGIANHERRLAAVPKVQQRRQWDADETTRFIELIEAHGCSWSMLKRLDEDHEDGPRLEGRDQVALKDKARNMKMDYLMYVNLSPNPVLSKYLKSGPALIY